MKTATFVGPNAFVQCGGTDTALGGGGDASAGGVRQSHPIDITGETAGNGGIPTGWAVVADAGMSTNVYAICTGSAVVFAE